MSELEAKQKESIEESQKAASDILRPTLQDNDFLQSFVRIGLEEPAETRHATFADQTHLKRMESFAGSGSKQQLIQSQDAEPRRSRESTLGVRTTHHERKSVQQVLQDDLKQKTKRRRRRKSDVHRQEEVYTDKDRAAAVNMGSRDIKQSLKIKRKQDRSKAMQIPEEADPSAMLALGTRELRCGNFAVAINCIDKALELSPGDKNALIARSKCHLLLGEPQKALEDSEAALRGSSKDAHCAKALFSKAEALYHLGDFELSLVFYYRGMKIRPEFDQFRLGIQKAKEAIQNILGNNSVPLPKKASSRAASHGGADEVIQCTRPKTCSPATFLGSEVSEGAPAKLGLTSGQRSPFVSKSYGIATRRRRVRSNSTRPSHQELQLLGQLNVDKRYLQDLIKRPERKRADFQVYMETEKESEYAFVQGINGPVVTVNQMRGSAMHELVKIGHEGLLGEVIRLNSDEAVVQVFEETGGLTVGEPVSLLGRPLSVELGPGLLGSIYDGIQRPLKDIRQASGSIYLPRGLELPAVSRTQLWEFQPAKLRLGGCVTGGDVLGHVYENGLVKHRVMLEPRCRGQLRYLAVAGCYAVDEVIAETEVEGLVREHRMLQRWAVREPRPCSERLPVQRPLLTGLRVLDSLFPVGQGASAAVPGGFGCGKTTIAQALAKYSNSDAIVYVCCGERGNEMAEVLRDLPELAVEVGGLRQSLMQRTSLVSNASNMPVAAREASVYTGACVAEYFRDQGLHVALVADSTSRWAEALREIGGRLGEMPGDAGYPAYLSARLAGFYERAGLARCLGAPGRLGSLSILGVVSPPAGDFRDPVTSATLGVVQGFWALDKRLAERKHFPAVDWLAGYTRCLDHLGPYYDAHFPLFYDLRRKALDILYQKEDISRLVQLVGCSSLSNSDKLVLEVASLLTDDFLQQNCSTFYDSFCPFYKTYGILKNILGFYELAKKALQRKEICDETTDSCGYLTWNILKAKLKHILYRLSILKFLSPTADGENIINKELDMLYVDMQRTFDDL